ncbi:MAG TPA: LysM peptidoglycan-binding domain-containing protein [Chthoniobacterales bacterium]|nr:LysM peptidoglycan-binding domain-containing protein [Chthoniobacterales bacterium]
MKLTNLLSRKKLRATTARRGLGVPDDMDYEEMSEPNMKLSRALLIVLVLHVVAVAGIIAFNTIKSRQGPLPLPPVPTKSVSAAQTTSVKSDKPSVSVSSDQAATRKEDSIPVRVATKATTAKDEKKTERPKPTESTPAKTDSGKTYVVAKGDTPVSIARKFKITSDALMAANNIEDSHKLKVGRTLTIPTKSAKKKKAE